MAIGRWQQYPRTYTGKGVIFQLGQLDEINNNRTNRILPKMTLKKARKLRCNDADGRSEISRVGSAYVSKRLVHRGVDSNVKTALDTLDKGNTIFTSSSNITTGTINANGDLNNE
jgi:hypothetical protein